METDAEHVLPDEIQDEAASDARADMKALLVIFTALVLFALHFASQWSFDVTYDLF